MIKIDEIKFIEKHGFIKGSEQVLAFSKEEGSDGVCICSTDDLDNTQHDYTITKKDWEMIKKVVDSYFEEC